MWLTAAGGGVTTAHTSIPREVAAMSIAPELWDLERRHGSILAGKLFDAIQFLSFGKNFQASAFRYQSVHAHQHGDQVMVEPWVAPPKSGRHYALMSFTEGMRMLTDTLRKRVGEDRFKTSAKIESIERTTGEEAENEWKVRYRRNIPRLFRGLEEEAFDSIVFAAPLNKLGSEIQVLEEGKKSNVSWLPQMKYSKVSALILGFKDLSGLLKRANGGNANFGNMVVPLKGKPYEKGVCSSVIQNSRMFSSHENKSSSKKKKDGKEEEAQELLTVVLREDRIKGVHEPAMLEMALDDLEEILGISESPVSCQLVQWNDNLPTHLCSDASRNRATAETLEEMPGMFLIGGCHGTSGCIDEVVTQAHLAAAKVDKLHSDLEMESAKLARASTQGNLMLLDGILQYRRKLRQACASRQHQWNVWGTEDSDKKKYIWGRESEEEEEDLSSLPLRASVQLLMHRLGLTKKMPKEFSEARRRKPKPRALEYFEAQRAVKEQVDRELTKEKILMRGERINTIAEIRAETLRLRNKASEPS
jgi:protoporphyrinogen oxidase